MCNVDVQWEVVTVLCQDASLTLAVLVIHCGDGRCLKLADFGCSKQLQGLRTSALEKSLKAIRGSVPWMAPEVIKQTGHGRKADVWSIGCTIVEMLTAKHPWPAFENNITALFHVATAGTGAMRQPTIVPCCIETLFVLIETVSDCVFFFVLLSGPPTPDGLSDLCLDALDECFKIQPEDRCSAEVSVSLSWLSRQ